jgi:hypothetical protein
MDIQKSRIWQQACGDTNRNYSKICLKWGVILNGPGNAGKFPECTHTLKAKGHTSKKITGIRRFAVEMQDGDLVVLRMGTNIVLGVGIIVGDYLWSDCFADVDGWDLQHVRRVKWLWDGLKSPKYFPTYTLKQGDTTQVLTSDKVKKWLEELDIPPETLTAALTPLPHVGKKVNEEEIAEYLYEQGVSSNSIEIFTREFNELRRIAKWYVDKESPSEFETVAYLVVPILRALG